MGSGCVERTEEKSRWHGSHRLNNLKTYLHYKLRIKQCISAQNVKNNIKHNHG